VKVCDKTCIFFFFPIINKYFLMANRSLLSRCPSYFNRCCACHTSYQIQVVILPVYYSVPGSVIQSLKMYVVKICKYNLKYCEKAIIVILCTVAKKIIFIFK